MSGTASSAARASSASYTTILPSGHVYWGILERIEPVGDGLILVKLSDIEHLVDESLRPRLSGLIGQMILIDHIDGRWGTGAVTA